MKNEINPNLKWDLWEWEASNNFANKIHTECLKMIETH